MCGIAGAVPHPESPESHVRLGDIVVCDRTGVIQYDRGKQRDPRLTRPKPSSRGIASRMFWGVLRMLGIDHPRMTRDSAEVNSLEGFECRGSPRPPCPQLLAAVRRIDADQRTLSNSRLRLWESFVDKFLEMVGNPEQWKRPDDALDLLIDDKNELPIPHPKDDQRRSGRPRVFYGPIGAANVVQADPRRRNELRRRHALKAIEMESSGVADLSWLSQVGYIVVRGTCDYCNSEKGDAWHNYAALAAAAYTRTILAYLPRQPGSQDRRLLLPSSPAFPIENHTLSSIEGHDALTQGERKSETIPRATVMRQHFTSVELGSPATGLGIPAAAGLTNEQELLLRRHGQVEDLTKVIQQLLKEHADLEKFQPHCMQLEKELELLPRAGAVALAGWTMLAQVESRTQLERRQLGLVTDPTRLRYLRGEAEKCL